MSLIRVKHCDFELKFDAINYCESRLDEWNDTDINRVKEPAWETRYQYESHLICQIINENNINTILELGSGPGKLSSIIQSNIPRDITYHLVDKPFAKKYFDEQNYKGNFFIQDISTHLITTELLPEYDLIICNDTLEHLYAPSNIVKTCYNLMNNTSVFFISIPNWRMAHQFIYRGLWDYDNFLYFMYIHKLEPLEVYPSPLQTPYYSKLDSEESMPNELLQSWNFYFHFKKKI